MALCITSCRVWIKQLVLSVVRNPKIIIKINNPVFKLKYILLQCISADSQNVEGPKKSNGHILKQMHSNNNVYMGEKMKLNNSGIVSKK